MNNLEKELKAAMSRHEPSPDFAERVLSRIADLPAPRPGWWKRLWLALSAPASPGTGREMRARWLPAAATAVLCVALLGAAYWVYRARHPLAAGVPIVARSSDATEEENQTAPPSDKESPNGAPLVPSSNGGADSGAGPKSAVASTPPNHRRVGAVRKAAGSGVSQEESSLEWAEAREAHHQLEIALYITSTKLNLAHKEVEDSVNPPNPDGRLDK